MFKNKYFVMGIIFFFATFCVQDVFADGYSMTVSTGGPQSIDVVLGSDSKGTSISEDNITVNTTCRYGYNLTIGTTVNDNNLYLNGDSSNNASGTFISSLSSPTALSEATNSWGYYFNRSATPTASSTFSPVPTTGSASLISELATPSSSDISDSFSVYYGVTVSQPAAPTAGAYIIPGIYKMIEDNNNDDGAIVYYFTMANNCMPYTINYSPTSTSTGSSVSGTGTMSPQEGYKDVQITLSPMGFTPPSGYEFKEWNTAQDGTGTSYADEDSITDITTPGSSITLYAIWHQPRYLYNEVAKLNRGTLAENNILLTDSITTPTSINKNEDTSNSGVFTYDASVYGVSSDAANNYPIYFYRGILETNPASYGVLGSANAYPNYVKLDNNTCWRILRTTGSGGVKMIYSGIWGATTSGSCANGNNKLVTQTNIAFNSLSAYNVHSVGYTYNSSMNNVTTDTSVDIAFGNDSNPSLNNTRSTVKAYLEDTWYAYNMTDYTDILESNAGYCNDRTVYSAPSLSPTAINSVIPYNTSTSASARYYFGPNERNRVSGATPSLTCPRDVVDLYRYVPNSSGLGNELKYPVALITADEQTFAGSGNSSNSAFKATSFLAPDYSYGYNSGNGGDYNMSPDYKYGRSYLLGILTNDEGEHKGMTNVESIRQAGVRPVISLVHQVYVASGSGTSTDPWLITTEDPDEVHPINLYNAITEQSKGTQTAANLQTNITTANSGVYEYNSSVFGADTDGLKEDNSKATIYYYRGILDNAFTNSTYGSSGNGELSPNYVILSSTGEKGTSDTCWRIIRTTGSGGIKMIYNGKWTGSTCANARNDARTGTSAYNNTATGSNLVRRIALTGYTYNDYGNNTGTTNTSTDNLFGTNTNLNNTTNSTIKGNVDTWYDDNLSSFTSILEPNAGFCNDRTTYSDEAGSNAVNSLKPSENITTNNVYLGAYSRNGYNSATRIPSLACPSTRSTVDVYSTSSADAGNKLLSRPIALITADELSFAGAGSQTANQGSAYSASSFVRSGNSFWTMSPHSRLGRNTYVYYSNANGYLSNGTITTTTYDVRPVISLKEGTKAITGTGTAVDPWVVKAP